MNFIVNGGKLWCHTLIMQMLIFVLYSGSRLGFSLIFLYCFGAVRATVFCFRENVQALSPEVQYHMRLLSLWHRSCQTQDFLTELQRFLAKWISIDWMYVVAPQVLQHILLDLPGLLFFTTYTLLVLFWAEIYHQVQPCFVVIGFLWSKLLGSFCSLIG
jgi:hypothetical protein